ncbi:MAG: Lrp/AsnC family transcriptional regulator [Phycisphaerales bacterium]|nr:Lrp/AsnC family transcriptional regulator [Phycisphaerales bacterium]
MIEILRTEGRAVGRTFANAIGLSEATVSRRLAAIAAAGLVQVRGYIDPFVAGCHTVSLIRFATKDSPAVFATALAKGRDFYRVAAISSQSEVVALAATADSAQCLESIDAMLAEHPGVSILSASPVLAIIPPIEARPHRHAAAHAKHEPQTIRQRQIQERLIRALQIDFRATFLALGKSASVSAPAVSLMVPQMIAGGILQHVVVVDPHFVQRPLCAHFRITVAKDIEKTARLIGTTLNPEWVFVCLAHEQICVEASLANETEMSRLQQTINALPAVLKVTCHPLSVVYKNSFAWNNGDAA